MRDPIAHVERYLPQSAIESLRQRGRPTVADRPMEPSKPYTAERRGGCTILWLGGKPGDGRTRTNLPDRGVFGVYKKGQEAP